MVTSNGRLRSKEEEEEEVTVAEVRETQRGGKERKKEKKKAQLNTVTPWHAKTSLQTSLGKGVERTNEGRNTLQPGSRQSRPHVT